jgi:dolichol-phosphate mannosyltransferase
VDADVDRILIFIPMYNCAPQIPRVIAQFNNPRVAELIAGVVCVDNRSSDGTIEAAISALEKAPVPNRCVLRNDYNYGLGGSHKVAIQYARDQGFNHIVVLHGDDQGSVSDIIPLILSGVHRQADCLLGARFMRGSRLVGYSWLRVSANHVFNVLFSVAAGRRLFDLGSGLNHFQTSMFDSDFHFRFADDLTFNYYLILAIAHYRFKSEFFPLTWREDDQISNARLWRHGIQMLTLLARRLQNRERFFTAEHRRTPLTAYPSTKVAEFVSQRVPS